MKTATITFQNTNNYGASLQCYALQTALKGLGIDNEVIDYESDYLNKPYKFAVLKEKGLVRFILGNVYAIIRSPRNKKFKEFRKEIKMSVHVDRRSISEIEPQYDKFISGSDQVWNGSLVGYDDVYFLKFVSDKKKRFSYSASFGFKTVSPKLVYKYKKLLEGYSYYSVRETTGVEIISDILGIEANHTIDPTLLLTKNEWEKVMKAPSINEKYILVYQIEPSRNLLKVVEKLRVKTGLKVIAIPFVMGFYPKAKMMFTSGPAEWVGLFRNAEYIVTDSFHGTAFSVIFNKKFWACVDPNESRKTSFLKLIGLENRLIYSDKSLPDNLLEDIDYEDANRVIQYERYRCLGVLRDIIIGDSHNEN